MMRARQHTVAAPRRDTPDVGTVRPREQDGDCAAAAGNQAVEVDHGWFRRGEGLRLRDQILPSGNIGGVDLATRMDNHGRVVICWMVP